MVFGRSDDSHAVLQRVTLDVSDFSFLRTTTDSMILTSAIPQFWFSGLKVRIAVGRVGSPLEPLPSITAGVGSFAHCQELEWRHSILAQWRCAHLHQGTMRAMKIVRPAQIGLSRSRSMLQEFF